ncbi:MAG: acetoacetate--CoA ligase [Solirubrobacterales bacterium]
MSANSAPGRLLWEPDRETVEAANLTDFLGWLRRRRGVDLGGDYAAFWAWSTEELEEFWQAIWDYYEISASQPASLVLDRRRVEGARWFPGARLNYAEEVLGRAPTDEPAILAVAEDRDPRPIQIEELRGQVGALAAALRELGVEKGDRVAAYAGNRPETVVAMLATTAIGAVWTVCAPDFGEKGVLDRFGQVEPKVLFAVDGYRFGGNEHPRLETVKELQAALPSLRATILIRALGSSGESLPGDLDAVPMEELLSSPAPLAFEQVEFDHPLWILYSSGTTGAPKGIVQSHGGILVEHLKSLGLGMDIRAGDNYYFFSSTSWMAWNYLVGGLLHGATIVLYDGSPGFPDLAGSWRIVAATRASVFGTGAAYVSACANAGLMLGAEIDLSALRSAIPTGSPLPPAGWAWLHDQLGPAVRIDPIAGGTDVCTVFVGGSPLLPVHLGRIPCRWPGVAVDIFDPHGSSIRGEVGEFVVTEPMPSMPVHLWNDSDGVRYRDTYFDVFPGVWRQGDWASISAEGEVTMLGRSDSTLNRAGVRIGSAEIYASVEAHPEVADSLVIGAELEDGSYWMPLFVVTVEGADLDEDLRDRIVRGLRAELSPRHVPDEIVAAPAVPRTRTGKKLEVPVKRILQGTPLEEAAALGAVEDPDALSWYVNHKPPAAREEAA